MKSKLNEIYISEALKDRLDRIGAYPLTTVVAPAGYGKSTALRYFCQRLPENGVFLWQNVLSSSVTDFWKGFSEMFASVSEDFAEALCSMGTPPADGTTQREFLRLLRNTFSGVPEVYIFIDDVHLVMNQELYDFVSFFTKNVEKTLHLILTSRRPILRMEDALRFAGQVNELTERDLRFRVEDISCYFMRCGFSIRMEDAVYLAKISEGWVSILYLHLKTYADTGTFADAAEIHAMMGVVLYDPLSEDQKRLLTAVSILEEWTAEQAAYIGENKQAEDLLKKMCRNNAFLYYSAKNGNYRLHHLLRESVQKVFAKLPDQQQRRILDRAGEWCARVGDDIAAVQFFYQAKDFENLMRSFEESLGETVNGEHKQQMLRWFADCPPEILDAHPVAMLVYGRRLFTFNMQRECKEILQKLREKLQNDTLLSEEQRNNVLGEIEVNESFLEFNDVGAMSVHHRRACQLLNRPTASMSPNAAWTFGAASVLDSYHRQVGELEREVAVMKQSMPFWYQINRNQGSGAEHLMEAERYFNLGALDDAEICLHRGLNACVRDQKLDMEIMAAFIQLRLELVRGRFDHVAPVLEELRGRVMEQKKYILLHTLDVCEAWMFAMMDQTEPCAEWISDGNFAVSRLMFPAVPTLRVAYRQTLLARKKYAELIGCGEEDRAICRVFPNVTCEIYLDIQLAAAYGALGKQRQAMERIAHGLDLAMPDSLFMPFVFQGDRVSDLLRELKNGVWGEQIKTILALSEPYQQGKRIILREYFSQCPTHELSGREMEIARLAAVRKTNQEIAQALNLSENTIKSSLRVIFQKLGLDEGGRGKRKILEQIIWNQ
ncbi:MAG: LuxR C-terminal-related transcriptional regulator [Lawsonibacter sp.]